MEFTDVRSEDGVTRRSFTVSVAGESVPAVIWAPEGAAGPRPLVLMGHGGSQHKKTPGIRTRAVQYAQRHGYATLAIDAPGHGDRISRAEAATLMRDVGARVRGETPGRLHAGAHAPDGRALAPRRAGMEGGAGRGAGLRLRRRRRPGRLLGRLDGHRDRRAVRGRRAAHRRAIFGLAGLREGATELPRRPRRSPSRWSSSSSGRTRSPPARPGRALQRLRARRRRPCTSTPAATWTSPTSRARAGTASSCATWARP